MQSDGKKCGACLKKCPKDCIHLDEQDQVVELEVGNIVLATGYDLFDASAVERYGYGKLPNVLTSLEFERMTNASGPTGGKIVLKTQEAQQADQGRGVGRRRREGPPPKSVAIIHCVGSRDANYNPYCSRVCCMYSLKFAHLVREKLPERQPATSSTSTCGPSEKATRSSWSASRPRAPAWSAVAPPRCARSTGRWWCKGEDILHDKVVEFPVDLVILAVGRGPGAGDARVGRRCSGCPRDPDGWFSELNYNGEPTEHRAGRRLRGRHVPGAQGYSRHGGPGLGGGGRRARAASRPSGHGRGSEQLGLSARSRPGRGKLEAAWNLASEATWRSA